MRGVVAGGAGRGVGITMVYKQVVKLLIALFFRIELSERHRRKHDLRNLREAPRTWYNYTGAEANLMGELLTTLDCSGREALAAKDARWLRATYSSPVSNPRVRRHRRPAYL